MARRTTQQDAATKQADARKEANADKRAADYKVAIEKCDALAGPGKDACVSNATLQLRQVLRSTQVSLAALFCGQREGLVSATGGLFFPRRFFVRGAPHLGPTDANCRTTSRVRRDAARSCHLARPACTRRCSGPIQSRSHREKSQMKRVKSSFRSRPGRV